MLLPEAASAVSAGSYHTLFLAESGDVWACGSNNNGQLGLGNDIECAHAPRRIPALAGLSLRLLSYTSKAVEKNQPVKYLLAN